MLRSDDKRPDGVTLPWSRGRTLVWDFTCPATVAQSRVHQTPLATGVAASDAESKKLAKYSELIQNHVFVPFAVETLGAWAPVLGLCRLRLGLGFPGRRGTHGQQRSFVRTLTSRYNGAMPPPFWAPFIDASVTFLTVEILNCNSFLLLSLHLYILFLFLIFSNYSAAMGCIIKVIAYHDIVCTVIILIVFIFNS